MKKILFGIITCIFFNSCYFVIHHPGRYYKKAKSDSYDAVIIPGFPYDGKNWNKVMKYRLLWAKHLHENKLAKNFIFSGGAVHTPYNEGYIMAMYASKMGIPKENIIIEPYAQHSSENVYFSLKICQEKNFKKIAIATDPFQSFLISNYAQRIRNISIDYLILQPRLIREHKYYDEPKINADLAIENNFIPIKERQSYIERKKGSLGLNIDYGVKTNKFLKYSKWFWF